MFPLLFIPHICNQMTEQWKDLFWKFIHLEKFLFLWQKKNILVIKIHNDDEILFRII